jgi:hypothetical protein
MLPKLDPIVESLAKSMSHNMFATMDRVTKETGNVFDAKGEKIRAEHLLELWGRMDVNFNQDGSPKWPTIIIHPNVEERLRGELIRLSDDPLLRASLEKLVQQKREEWRAREANRILVG